MPRWMDADYLRMRGLARVRGEFNRTVLAYNLQLVLQVVRIPHMLAVLA
jgi:hypothetical protein